MRHFTTLPALLATRGYRSFQGGKWWERSFRNGHFTEGMSKGWDEAQRSRPGWSRAFMGGPGLALTRETQEPVYDFIDRQVDTPFFLWYAPSLPHILFDAPQEYTRRYANAGLSKSAEAYYANCTWFDDGAGDLIAHIDRRGLADQTLYILRERQRLGTVAICRVCRRSSTAVQRGPEGKALPPRSGVQDTYHPVLDRIQSTVKFRFDRPSAGECWLPAGRGQATQQNAIRCKSRCPVSANPQDFWYCTFPHTLQPMSRVRLRAQKRLQIPYARLVRTSFRAFSLELSDTFTSG